MLSRCIRMINPDAAIPNHPDPHYPAQPSLIWQVVTSFSDRWIASGLAMQEVLMRSCWRRLISITNHLRNVKIHLNYFFSFLPSQGHQTHDFSDHSRQLYQLDPLPTFQHPQNEKQA